MGGRCFSVFAIGDPFGVMLAGTVSNKKGRRAAITVNMGMYNFGGMLFALAPSIMRFIPARFLVDFAFGLFVNKHGGVHNFACFIRLAPLPPLFLLL